MTTSGKQGPELEREAASEKLETMLYRTSDLYFSAYLAAIDIPLVATEPEENGGKRKVIFVFRIPVKDKERLKTMFFGGRGTVRALDMCQQLKTLKQLCYV